MKALLQRVSYASVTVDGRITGQIDKGFVVLLGVNPADTREEAEWLANKIAGIRLFEDDQGKMNLDLKDVGGDLLVVSQFTLYGDARKGRRPSFTDAARPETAEPLVEFFVEHLRTYHGFQVATGVFGAMMKVEIHNDGPVTLMLEK